MYFTPSHVRINLDARDNRQQMRARRRSQSRHHAVYRVMVGDSDNIKANFYRQRYDFFGLQSPVRCSSMQMQVSFHYYSFRCIRFMLTALPVASSTSTIIASNFTAPSLTKNLSGIPVTN